jgi:hypothetical protein
MENAFSYEVGAPYKWFTTHPNTGQIYLGIWPQQASSGWPGTPEPMFDIVDGEREYVAYFDYH